MDWSSVDSAWKGHEYFVQWLVKELDPKITVEIGTYKGFSTYFLAKENNGIVYSLDIKDYGAADNLKELDNVKLIIDRSEDLVKTWQTKIDLLHIDGDHTKDSVTHDLSEWAKHMNDGGVILMHDVFSNAWLDTFMVFMNSKILDINGQGITKRMFLNSNGLGILTYNTELISKIDEKYKTLVLSDHSIANIVNFVNYHRSHKNG